MMAVQEPHILITNDDGVFAPGLFALVQTLRDLGDVTIVAPDRNWSASGHVKTMHRPLRVKEVQLEDGTPALATDGAPSDCVALTRLGLIERKVDLVVSGINPNANIGHDVTYSGTVTAAMEAAIWGIPGIAVSLDSPENFDGLLNYAPAAKVTKNIVQTIQEIINGNGKPLILNINIPYLSYEEMKGIQITRLGLRIYRDALVRREDPRGRPYYWIGGESPTGIPETGTDFGALREGTVSVTPLNLDLTDYDLMGYLSKQLKLN